MKKKREKGLKFQRWIKAWLENKGWVCANIPPRAFLIKDKKTGSTRFVSFRNDIFGCDLVARKTFTTSTDLGKVHTSKELWIQATASEKAGIGEKLKEIARFPLPDSTEIDTQVWIKTKPGLVNVYSVYSDEGDVKSALIGKIIYAKFYATEGESYEY